MHRPACWEEGGLGEWASALPACSALPCLVSNAQQEKGLHGKVHLPLWMQHLCAGKGRRRRDRAVGPALSPRGMAGVCPRCLKDLSTLVPAVPEQRPAVLVCRAPSTTGQSVAAAPDPHQHLSRSPALHSQCRCLAQRRGLHQPRNQTAALRGHQEAHAGAAAQGPLPDGCTSFRLLPSHQLLHGEDGN